jgi:cardiolipin synthase (CMP-forming)
VRVFDIGAKDGPEQVSDRVLTVPNLLSFARLAVLPLVYVDLVDGRHLRALVLLSVFTATDWFDGYLARRFDQVTRLGKVLDPLSDRVLFVVVGVGFAVGGLLPWWAVLLLLARDVALFVVVAVGVSRGRPRPEVTRLGKTATFVLMFALPMFLIASIAGGGPGEPQPVWQAASWATYAVGTMLYWLSAADYARRLARGQADDLVG